MSLVFLGTDFVNGSICPFVNYYQFFREVLFSLKKNGYFILLYDERNPAFLKVSNDGRESGLWPFLMKSVSAKHSKDIGKITIQQLVKIIADSGNNNDWINEFKLKYRI